MGLVPRLFGVALVASALAGGSGLALADGTVPGTGGLVALPPLSALSAQNSLLQPDGNFSSGVLPQKFGLQSSHWDFFSVRPESSSGDFTSLMRSGVGGGGVKFQLKW